MNFACIKGYDYEIRGTLDFPTTETLYWIVPGEKPTARLKSGIQRAKANSNKFDST